MLIKNKEENDKTKETREKNKENEEGDGIRFFEDTTFEKELKELNKNKKERRPNDIRAKKRLTKIRLNNDQNTNFTNRKKEKSNKKLGFLFKKHNSNQDLSQKNMLLIYKELSFLDDLSLSNLSDGDESKSNESKGKLIRKYTNFRPKKNIFLTKLIADDFKKNIDNLSFDDDLFNNNVFNKYKRKRKKTKDFDNDRSTNNLEFNRTGNKSVINAKTIELYDDYIVKSDFERPHSILNNIIKYEEDQIFSKSQIRFNLQKFLKTEAEKDNEFLNKDRRKSFLGFLEYAQFHNEINELNELIENESSNNEIEDNEEIDNKDKKNDMLFLSEDSFISRINNVTLEDIELLPMYLNEQKIYKNEYLIHDNVKKNVDSNKLTQKIRAEVFDRKSINTNINLKTNEMKKEKVLILILI